MGPEDVPEELVVAAMAAYSDNEWRTSEAAFRAALAAVLPLAVAEEREACWQIAIDEMLAAQNDVETSDDGSLLSRLRSEGGAASSGRIATFIRSRGEPQ